MKKLLKSINSLFRPMPYKYTTTLEADIVLCKIGDKFISQASLNNLQPLLPKNINLEDNIDLLPVAFNCAVVNMFNKNGDGISSATALAYCKNFLHKPTNIEHDKEKIVGHIASVGFSDYETSELLDEDGLEELESKFNIALGALVYKSANKGFAEALEKSVDPDSPLYQRISTSWEIGFSDYVIAVGGPDLSSARIVSDEKEKEELKGALRAYGGSGITKGGLTVNRLIVGKIYPLGIGFTTIPAANVKGIIVADSINVPLNISDSKEKKISQTDKINVKMKNNHMEDLVINELKVLLSEKKFSEEAIASMTSTFADAIKQKDEQYQKDLAQAKEEKESLVKEQDELKASVLELQKQFAEAQTKISDFEAAQKAELAVASFNQRMDKIDAKFELEDEDRQFLANELKTLDITEEAFASFEDKLNILWRHKDKEVKAKYAEEMEAKIKAEVEKRMTNVSTASENKTPEQILEDAQKASAAVSSSNESTSGVEESFSEKMQKALKRENVIIS